MSINQTKSQLLFDEIHNWESRRAVINEKSNDRLLTIDEMIDILISHRKVMVDNKTSDFDELEIEAVEGGIKALINSIK